MQTVKTINFLLMCLFFACYMYQFLYIPVSWLPRRREKREAPLHRFAILIAACDEEAVIGNLLDSIKAQSYPLSQALRRGRQLPRQNRGNGARPRRGGL